MTIDEEVDQSNVIEIPDNEDFDMDVMIDLTCEQKNRLRYGDFLDLTIDDCEYEVIEPVQYETIDLCE
jgi:hypothetical protein